MGLAEIFGILFLLMIVVFAIVRPFMKDDDLDLDKIREESGVDQDMPMASSLFTEDKDKDD